MQKSEGGKEENLFFEISGDCHLHTFTKLRLVILQLDFFYIGTYIEQKELMVKPNGVINNLQLK